MATRIDAWLRDVLTRTESDDGDDDSRFAGSLLDASVNEAHGASDGAAVRELQQASEVAGRLRRADDRDR
jgi:hypothetical protein